MTPRPSILPAPPRPSPALPHERGSATAAALLAGVGQALPEHRYRQEEIVAHLARMWHDRPAVLRRLASLHEHTRVSARHLALPLQEYEHLDTFGKANDAWIRVARRLGGEAVRAALAAAGLEAGDLSAIFAATVTGIASPSLDAMLINELGLRPDVKRMPLFGLGCVAGAAGLARVADYLRAYPDQAAVLLCVELCSLNFQREDLSVAALISTGLFGDGAAAVVLVGPQHPRAAVAGAAWPELVATRSTFYPDTEDVMGWDISERGFRIVLSPAVPEVARTRLPVDVDAFLASQGLGRADIAAWIAHPGGPKVLQGMQDGLALTDQDFALSWQMLAEQGNLSSASVLMVLGRTLATPGRWPEGSLGLLLAMGPGFCSEVVLLRR
ncbi:MAG: type III polyketide synthase [Planctomycetes bacterium]|nr:type III polyketide synthase [Planctomycetota bacterium]